MKVLYVYLTLHQSEVIDKKNSYAQTEMFTVIAIWVMISITWSRRLDGTTSSICDVDFKIAVS